MNAATMPIEELPDWDRRIARHDAFWSRGLIDRPVVDITFPRERQRIAWPDPRRWTSLRDRWMDAGYQADLALAQVANTEYRGDALPFAWPNLGPDVFAAWLGCDLAFAEQTSWSSPILGDWSGIDSLELDTAGPCWQAILAMTEALLAAGRNRFYVGLTDLHVGGDAAAALRGPEQLAIDLLEAPGEVRRLVERVTSLAFQAEDFFFDLLGAAGQPVCGHPRIVSRQRWNAVANDFSAMISPRLFDEVFLPGIEAECRRLEASIYHVDGRHALRHLDSLLAIPSLDAIQWSYGAGEGRASDWIPVYRRCQDAGKAIQVTTLEPDEVDLFIENLRPEGVWILMGGVDNASTAEAVIRKIERWR